MIIVLVSGEIQIEETKVSPVTTTVQEALFPLPSAAVAVIVAVPLEDAYTMPLCTVATLALLVFHVTERLVAFSGYTDAVSNNVSHTSIVALLLSSFTELTYMFPLPLPTFTLMESLHLLPSVAIA